MTTNPEVKQIKRKQKGSKKYYRGPLDKVVVESKMTAKKIAEKMGISYDRMVALRRVKSLSPEDLDLCQRAVAELQQGNIAPLQPVDEARKVKADATYFKLSKEKDGTVKSEKMSPHFKAVAPGEKVVIPNPFDTEIWNKPSNIVPMMPTTSDKLEKAAFLLGLAWSQLSLQREFLSRQGIHESEATEKTYMRLTLGIEELFYKDK